MVTLEINNDVDHGTYACDTCTYTIVGKDSTLSNVFDLLNGGNDEL